MTFEEHVSQRLAAGAVEYQDRSYGRPTGELIDEILEELADVGAWSEIALAGEPGPRVALALRLAQGAAKQSYEALQGASIVESIRAEL